jgi:choline dehydrogenase-like flavoprotein
MCVSKQEYAFAASAAAVIKRSCGNIGLAGTNFGLQDLIAKPVAVGRRDSRCGAMFHPSSTCAIGAETDPMAVVDSQCGVFGVDGLHVADASVMPSIVSANTNMTAMMIGERAGAASNRSLAEVRSGQFGTHPAFRSTLGRRNASDGQ